MQAGVDITAAELATMPVAVAVVLLRLAEALSAAKVAMAEAEPLALSQVLTWRMREGAVALGSEAQALAVPVVVALAAYNPMSRLEHPAQLTLAEVEVDVPVVLAVAAPASSLSATQFFNNGTLRTA
jgi:hypothetical protein